MREAAGDDGLFDFDFSDPDEYELHMGNYERFTFTAEMTNRTTGTQYELTSLSSGEKVLMTLCLVSFNQYLGRRRPKLFLLDELDAVLHPSMIAALVRTLKTLFVPQGAKILMTSHSPMTVAALDEADIFRVVRTGGHVNVSRTTKSEAIEELSEGLASIDVGLKIAAYDGAKVTILTEGHNAKHIKGSSGGERVGSRRRVRLLAAGVNISRAASTPPPARGGIGGSLSVRVVAISGGYLLHDPVGPGSEHKMSHHNPHKYHRQSSDPR